MYHYSCIQIYFCGIYNDLLSPCRWSHWIATRQMKRCQSIPIKCPSSAIPIYNCLPPLPDPSWAKWLGHDQSDHLLWCSCCCWHPGWHCHQHPSLGGAGLLREGDPDAPGVLSLLQHHQALPLSRNQQRRFLGLHPWNKVSHPSHISLRLYQVHFHGLGGSGTWLQHV